MNSIDQNTNPEVLSDAFLWDIQWHDSPIHPERHWQWIIHHKPTDEIEFGSTETSSEALVELKKAAEVVKNRTK